MSTMSRRLGVVVQCVQNIDQVPVGLRIVRCRDEKRSVLFELNPCEPFIRCCFRVGCLDL
jgi:hypothetical protein